MRGNVDAVLRLLGVFHDVLYGDRMRGGDATCFNALGLTCLLVCLTPRAQLSQRGVWLGGGGRGLTPTHTRSIWDRPVVSRHRRLEMIQSLLEVPFLKTILTHFQAIEGHHFARDVVAAGAAPFG